MTAYPDTQIASFFTVNRVSLYSLCNNKHHFTLTFGYLSKFISFLNSFFTTLKCLLNVVKSCLLCQTYFFVVVKVFLFGSKRCSKTLLFVTKSFLSLIQFILFFSWKKFCKERKKGQMWESYHSGFINFVLTERKSSKNSWQLVLFKVETGVNPKKIDFSVLQIFVVKLECLEHKEILSVL